MRVDVFDEAAVIVGTIPTKCLFSKPCAVSKPNSNSPNRIIDSYIILRKKSLAPRSGKIERD